MKKKSKMTVGAQLIMTLDVKYVYCRGVWLFYEKQFS